MITNLYQLSQDIEIARVGWFHQYEYGNLGMINANHKNLYPILHLLPPTSVILDPYNNSEQLTCIFHCYRPIIENTKDTSVGINAQEYMIEATHDDLMNRFVNTMQGVTLGNETKYVSVQQWSIERVMEEFNDGLIGVIITVTIERYSHCLEYNDDGDVNPPPTQDRLEYLPPPHTP